MQENAIEWLSTQKVVTVTLGNGRIKTQVEKLVESRPDEVQITARNSDGTIVAHVPLKWVNIRPTRRMSEEQKRQASERLKQYRAQK